MTTSRQMFGSIVSVDDEVFGGALVAEPGGPTIFTFANGATARLSGRDERSAAMRDLLRGASAAQVPVLVELGGGDEIADVRVPLPADAVTSVAEIDAQTIRVELLLSQSPLLLRRDHPEFSRLRAVLEAARSDGTRVFVTVSDHLEIMHVARADVPFLLEAAPDGRPLAAPPPMPLAEAEKLFDQMAAVSCDPRNPAGACITFLFPDDGCYARAHEMCRLIGPAKTGKAWIYGTLIAKTRNHPSCSVSWRYHVAPTVSVQAGAAVATYVLDPSLFAKPVPLSTWKGAQGDAGAKVVETDADPFYRSPTGETLRDSDYVETRKALATFRLALKERSMRQGPPPYAACPAGLMEEAVA